MLMLVKPGSVLISLTNSSSSPRRKKSTRPKPAQPIASNAVTASACARAATPGARPGRRISSVAGSSYLAT